MMNPNPPTGESLTAAVSGQQFICILVADDQTIVRAGIRQLVARIGHVQIVGEAKNGQEALDLVRSKRPNIVLMDIEMPGLNGFEATRKITQDFPDVKVIMLSSFATEQYVVQAIHAGAKGYIPKDSEVTELTLAIQSALKNQTYLSPSVSKNFLKHVRAAGKSDAPATELDGQQLEILRLIAEGKEAKEIAFMLNSTLEAVEIQQMEIMTKLDIHHVAGLVRHAIRIGLVPL